MAPKKVQVNFRIPEFLLSVVKKKAELEERSITELFIDALNLYMWGDLPGYCDACNFRNPPNAHFCSNCGLPMDTESIDKMKIEEIEKILSGILINKRDLYLLIKAEEQEKRKQKEKGENN